MSSEKPQIFNDDILLAADIYSATALKTQNILGSNASATAALGSILEEYNDRFESPQDILKQNFGDAASRFLNSNHAKMLEDYNFVKSQTPEGRAELKSDKLATPILLDVGVGNVQVYTAIGLLEEYNNRFPASDPLDLKKYNADYVRLASDLDDSFNTSTVKFASLMTEKALNWGAQNVSNWNTLDAQEREAFAVYFYNVGEEAVERSRNEKLAATGKYNVDIDNTDIAQEYLQNLSSIIERMQSNNDGLSKLGDLIANGEFERYERCFPAGILITLADNTKKPIEDIRHGDIVLSHDKNGNLTPSIVDKLFTNTTDAFIRLTFTDGREDLIATPGHHFLTETGDYMEIGHMARLGGGNVRVVDIDGSIVTAKAERIIYSAETAEMFEQAQTKTIAYSGNTVLKEDQAQGWKTYNFEVRETHTYIAGGVRVHNKSVLDFLEPEELQNLKDVQDTNNDGKLDFAVVDIDNGNIEYEVKTRDGVGNSVDTVREMTAYDKNGNLYYKQFIKSEKGETIVKNISLTGQQLGENVGKSLAPFLAQSFIDENDSVFKSVAVNSVMDTLLGNLGEIIGGFTHRAGVDYGSFSVFENLDDITDAALLDLGGDLTVAGIESAISVINQLIVAEIFEGVDLDGVDGAVLKGVTSFGMNNLLRSQAGNLIANPGFQNVLTKSGLSDASISKINDAFEAPTAGSLKIGVANVVFATIFNEIVPPIESLEGQAASAITSALVNFFNIAGNFGGPVGVVFGYVIGKIFDALFGDDPEPQAFARIGFDEKTGHFKILNSYSQDGGDEGLARDLAQKYIDGINVFVDTVMSNSNNYDEIGQWAIGHFMDDLKNAGKNGKTFADFQELYVNSYINTVADALHNDGQMTAVRALGQLNVKGLLVDLEENRQTVEAAALKNVEFLVENNKSSFKDAMVRFANSDLLYKLEGHPEVLNDIVKAALNQGVTTREGFVDYIEGRIGREFLTEEDIFQRIGTILTIADDYHKYLENQKEIDTQIAINPKSAFAAGWLTTLMQAKEMGLDKPYDSKGDWKDNNFFTADGNDRIDGKGGDDDIRTYGGKDTVDGGNGKDSIDGGDGDDSLSGGNGDDIVNGGNGGDAIQGGNGGDTLEGGAGNDTIYGGTGNDSLRGGTGNDRLYGGEGNDTLKGQQGNDTLTGGPGSDSLDGGSGEDWIKYDTEKSGATVNLDDSSANGGSAKGDIITEVENVYGTAYDDRITGNERDNKLAGDEGNDALTGGGGDDRLSGGDGDDILRGEQGNDYAHGGVGNDKIFGDDGADTLSGHTGDDQIRGGNGNDIIFGDDGNDAITGDAGHDEIMGGSGNDEISGGADNDRVFGGDGDDLIKGDDGHDHIVGGTGNDVVHGGNENDTIYGGDGHDILNGGRQNDEIYAGEGDDNIQGEDGNDRLVGAGGNDSILGDDGDDTLSGGDGHDSLSGQNGNDRLDGHEGHDLISGGNGNDLVHAGTGNDQIYGGNDNDFLVGEDGRDTILGEFGNDVVIGGGDQDSLDGGSGSDTLKGGDHNDTILGGDHDDRISGDAGHDVIDAGTGNDFVSGGNDNDAIKGGDGNDVVSGDDGKDHIDGGTGDDTLKGSTGDDTILGGSGNDEINGGSERDFLEGGDGHDKIWGSSGQDTLNGNAGNDSLDGGDDKDWIITGAGDDKAYGGTGNDTIAGQEGNDDADGGDGNDVLNGDDGNDTLKGGNHDDWVIGGNGNDILSGNDGNDNVFGENGHDTLSGGTGNDTLNGGEGYDEIHGDGDNNHLTGGNGDDLILAGAGHDTIIGDDGYDTIMGGAGNDVINGNAHNDLMYGQEGNDTVNGGLGQDEIFGDSGDDQLSGAENNDTIWGGLGDDKISGDDNNDKLSGGDGNDTLNGGRGFDEIHGASANDVIFGDDGDDRLFGGNGSDQLTGGTGIDVLSGGASLFSGIKIAHTGYDTETGWNAASHERKLADVNGDGLADIVGFASSVIAVSYGQKDGTFSAAQQQATTQMSNNAGGWSASSSERDVADVNGDGRADLVGFGSDRVYVALANNDGTFAQMKTAHTGYDAETGWNVASHERKLADVNGDGLADIVGFASSVVAVSYGQKDGTFSATQHQATTQMSNNNGGWNATLYERDVADVNGDGRADLVGFGSDRVYVALANSDGTFAQMKTAHTGYDTESGWSVASHERKLADVNGDGLADIVGFANSVVAVSYGQKDGTFSAKQYQVTDQLTNKSGSWNASSQERDVADVNGDGRADLVGFGSDNVYIALANSDNIGDGDRDAFVFNSIADSGIGSGNREIVFDFEIGIDDFDLRGIDANTKTTGDQAFGFNGTTAKANAIWFTAEGNNLIVRGDVNGDGKGDFEIEIIGIKTIAENDFLL